MSPHSRLRLIVTLASLTIATFQLGRIAEAQAYPSPATSPTPAASPPPAASPAHALERTRKPNAFTVNGNFRAYDFGRQNASGFPSTANQLNQQSINFGTNIHLNYEIGNSGFSVGGTYFYSNPLNGCADPRSTRFNCLTLSGPAALANPEHLNPDTTLPGYSMSTFYEAYVQYEKNGLFAKIGDQVINTPWAFGEDTRLKPDSFEGADIAYKLTPNLTVEAMDMGRYQPRTSSDFLQETLLTGAITELPLTKNPPANTGGFQYGRLGYTNGSFVSNLHYYHFGDIANFAWLDGKYIFATQRFKPWIAIQAGDQRNTGASVIGQINSQVYGTQVGLNLSKNLAFSVGADVIPHHVQNLPPGVSCNTATGQITPTQAFPNPSAGFFVGTNVPQCMANGNGTFSVDYGGLASPYTFSHATDPLFTTSLTQGMIERGAGSSEKLALTYTSTNKRLVLSASQAYYDYGFNNAPDQTVETNGDALYYLRPLTSGPYHGLLLRFRYGVRTDDHASALNVPPEVAANGVFFGSLPYFVYTRAQVEYDF